MARVMNIVESILSAIENSYCCLLPCACCLLNHLLRPHHHHRRNRQAKRLGGFKINHQLELRRLLDRNVGWLGAFQDLVDHRRYTLVGFGPVGSVG